MQAPEFRDARNLLYLIIKKTVPGSPDPTPVQYEICSAMQAAMAPVIFKDPSLASPLGGRLVVEGFRGAAKSLIASVMTIWGLTWNPSANFLIVSASKERADAFSTFTLRCIREIPELQWLRPTDNSRDSMVAFDVGPAPAAHAPSVRSVGITGMITGSRSDVLIADDIEVPNNSETDAKRLKLAELVKEFAAIGKPLSATLFLGTPQIEMSLYNTLTQDRGYRRLIWPARYPDARWMNTYGHDLSPMLKADLEADPSIAGKPTDPTRFSEDVLLEKEAEYARSGFALQFMLDTSLSDASRNPLKLSDLMVADFTEDRGPVDLIWTNDPAHACKDIPSMGIGGDRLYKAILGSQEFAKFEGSLLSIDPAGRGRDELGLSVTKPLGARIFVPYIGGLRGGYVDENLIRICEIAKEQGVRKILAESNFGNGMFTALLLPHLKRIHPDCSVEEIHSVGQKERRIIETLEPILNQHRLVFSAKALRDDLRAVEDASMDEEISYHLQHQLTRITKERGSLRHDDRLDSLAIGVAFWVNFMRSTTEAARKKAIEREAEDEFLAWYRDSGREYPVRNRSGHTELVQRHIRRR